MSRPRPGSRRRRKLQREREEPGEWVPKQEKEPAQAAADPSEASTIESTTEATTSASAPDSKDTTDETKVRPCQHRHLPDRHYYYRQEKFERRFVALDRCIKERIYANIVKGRAAIDADTKKLRRQHQELLTKVKSEAEQIRLANQVDIRDTKKEINRLERKVEEIQEENETLRGEIARERRRMMYERYDGPSHDQQAERAE
ncbi:hypothetical protein NW756_001785 [Fusarium oxysporum]|nr:hypothetical protein NW763_008501 [Fusarium oxysporum]KAJ4069461.1 hypothetical protein NW753_000340 [Fusarium oxysporum]KAJ4101374.1 hypothetical protein NW756_001785 [Fusarium oxysporum]KAJ4118209.1 hypothetical protein NW769_003012 [Fusarium oxysporum]KAJ4227497.1 hypothetical protein NW760_008205 [Fusarium oxysporum]